MSANIRKRQRSENWIEEDKIILKDLVRERVRVLENKNTDTNSNYQKVQAWKNVQESFNCMCHGAPRSVAQLKTQWGHIKMSAKKEKASERKAINKTGGGPPPVLLTAPNTEDISSWLPEEFTVDWNEFDCDRFTRQDITVASTSKAQEEIMVVTPPVPFGSSCTSENIMDKIITVEHSVSPTYIPAHSPPPSCSPTHPSAFSPPPAATNPQLLPPKSGNVKKKMYRKANKLSPAEQVAPCEIECRRELHAIQISNEKLKES